MRLDQRARLGTGGREADKQLGRPGKVLWLNTLWKACIENPAVPTLKKEECALGGLHAQPGRTVGPLTI